MKRVLKVGLSILMVSMILMTLAGCGYKEAGDFLLEKAGDGYAIMDLSKEGYQKKELLIYSQIEGINIVRISSSIGVTIFGDNPPVVKSQILEKVYFINYIFCENEAFFAWCSNLKKIIYFEIGENGTDPFIGSEDWIMQYVKKEDYLQYNYLDYMYPANVSYYLNYEVENHDGYHWIDDYDYGSKITYIPEDPTREGYIFDGWYKEENCLNKWNFETDTLPEAILDEEGEPVYQETKLYAKWIRESF